jgi:hypothetical protein
MNVTDRPLAAADHYEAIADKVKAFIAVARTAAADGLTWGEFGQLLLALVKVAIHALDTLDHLTGAEKKEIVVHSAGVLFDAIADKAVPLALYPVWLIARPAVRSLIVALAGGAVEILLPMVRALA